MCLAQFAHTFDGCSGLLGSSITLRHRRLDANVFNVSLAHLANIVPLATGDATQCGHCGALWNADTHYRRDGLVSDDLPWSFKR